MNAATQASRKDDFGLRKLSSQSGRRAHANGSERIYNVLFVSRGNSAQARMAGALLNRQKGGKYRTFMATGGEQACSEEAKREIDEHLRKLNLNCDSIEEVPLISSPPMDFVIIFDDGSGTEGCTSWRGNPEVMKWRITRPSFDGEQKERERSFRRTLCELETRLNLFLLVSEKSEREAASTIERSFLISGVSKRS
jgi:protein-tyrosine-phosphatase